MQAAHRTGHGADGAGGERLVELPSTGGEGHDEQCQDGARQTRHQGRERRAADRFDAVRYGHDADADALAQTEVWRDPGGSRKLRSHAHGTASFRQRRWRLSSKRARLPGAAD